MGTWHRNEWVKTIRGGVGTEKFVNNQHLHVYFYDRVISICRTFAMCWIRQRKERMPRNFNLEGFHGGPTLHFGGRNIQQHQQTLAMCPNFWPHTLVAIFCWPCSVANMFCLERNDSSNIWMWAESSILYVSNLENPRFTERTSTNLGRSHRLPHVCTIMIYGKLGGHRLQETATFIYIYIYSQTSTSNLGIANVDIREI